MIRNALLMLAVGLASAAPSPWAAGAPDRPPDRPLLRRALADPVLWGRDAGRALASLDAWRGTGERRVTLYPDAVVGASQPDAHAAEQAAAHLARALRGTPGASGALGGRPGSAPLEVRPVPIGEDDSVRVVLTGRDLRVLPPGLTIAAVRERLGPPDRTSSRMIQNRTDNRPVVLRLYEYASGALVFAESNYAPRPGYVDRVYLDIPAALAARAGAPRRAVDKGGRR